MKKLVWYVVGVFIMCVLVACGNEEMGKRDDFTLKIINAVSEDIYEIGYAYYVNNELISSGGMCNADNSVLKNGDEIILDELPNTEKFCVEFSVTDKNGNTYPCLSKVNMEKGEKVTFQMEGDFETGFNLKILSKQEDDL